MPFELLILKRPISTATLQLHSERKKTFFRFSVATRLLGSSQFTLTQIDVPHPAGDLYRANLKRFAQGGKKTP